MKSLLATIFDRTTLIGSTGLGASILLKDISVIISIVVGLLTCVHLAIKIYNQINSK